MVALTTNTGFGIDPSQMQQRMQQRLADADTDQSNSLSKVEAQEALQKPGMSEAMFDKLFSQADIDGNGEISQQEQQDMLAHMEQRMREMGPGESSGFGPGNGSSSTLESLLESLSEDAEDDDEKSEFEKALAQLRDDPKSTTNQQFAKGLINDAVTPINTTA